MSASRDRKLSVLAVGVDPGPPAGRQGDGAVGDQAAGAAGGEHPVALADLQAGVAAELADA